MNGIVVMELKGFDQLTDQLALRMDTVGLTSERVRASIVHTVNDVVKKTKEFQECINWFYVGGDTWFFVLDDLESAVKFGCYLLKIFMQTVNQYGLFYLKPSVAINNGKPKIEDKRFYDNASIMAYRVADKGQPFDLSLVDKSIIYSERYSWIKYLGDTSVNLFGVEYKKVDWQNCFANDNDKLLLNDINIPALLLESEALYSESSTDAINSIVRQQAKSSSVIAFGGPVPLNIDHYKSYIKSTIEKLKADKNFKLTILNFLPLDEVSLSYSWLTLSKKLSEIFKENSTFSAFTIPKGQLRPFAYHIFDDSNVHIGLRSFSPQRGVSTMSGSIMFKNKLIAARFKEEFHNSWRVAGNLDEAKYYDICKELGDIPNDVKVKTHEIINEITNK